MSNVSGSPADPSSLKNNHKRTRSHGSRPSFSKDTILEFTPKGSTEPTFGTAIIEDSPKELKSPIHPHHNAVRNSEPSEFTSQDDNYFHNGSDSAKFSSTPDDVSLQSPTWLLSEILQNFSIKDVDTLSELEVNQLIIDSGNKLVALMIEYPQLKYEVILQLIINKIHFMFYSDLSEIKSLGYRILKHCIINEDSLLTLVRNKLLIFLIISLSTDSSSDLEKLYAIKLIHQFLGVPNGSTFLSIGIIKLLINLLDDEDLFVVNNQLKRLIMEILLEITISNPQLVYHSNGFNLLINNLIANTQDVVVQLNCLIVIIKLLEVSDYKFYFRNGYNLLNLISAFDDIGDSKRLPLQKLQSISFLLTVFLKNWNGFICASLNDFSFLKNLIELLYSPHLVIKETILDVLLDVLRVQSLPWLKDSKIGEFLLKFNPNGRFTYDNTAANNTGDGSGGSNPLGTDKDYSIIAHYLNHYQGLFAFMLIQLNLIDILINNLNYLQHDIKSTDRANFSDQSSKCIHESEYEKRQLSDISTRISDKIILLLTNLFKFSKIYLPCEFNLDFGNKIQLSSLIQMGNLSLKFDLPSSSKSSASSNSSAQYKNHVVANLTSQMNNLKLYKNSKLLLKNEENTNNDLKNLINQTKILTVKEFNEWEWDKIYVLFQNHLKLEKKFLEVLEKQPKFFKRLLSFYRPFKFRFCNLALKSTRNYKRIIQVGILIFETFSRYLQGIKYLYKNKILIQMSEILSQINPYSGIAAKNPILSEPNLTKTVNFGYVTFLGKLTETANGIKLLNQWQVFQQLNSIIDSTTFSEYNNYFIILLFKHIKFEDTHDDLHTLHGSLTNQKIKSSMLNGNKTMLGNMKSHNNQLCNLLFKSLTVSNMSLKVKLVEMLPALSADKLFLVKLIINNLYQPKLSEKLINILYDNYFYKYNQDLNYLKLILDYNPSIIILSKYPKGQLILINFLLLPKGFDYLSKFNYINLKFNIWLADKQQFKILKFYENALNHKLFPYLHFSDTKNGDAKEQDYNFFLKKLLDTKEGLTFFQKFDHNTNFIDNLTDELDAAFAKLNNTELTNHEHNNVNNHQEDSKTMFPSDAYSGQKLNVKEYSQLKQNLWILGEINSSNYGIQLLDLDLFARIIAYFNTCNNWSIKGLLFYQLGKLSLNNEGLEILDELGWKFTVNTFDKFKNFSYPGDLSVRVFNNQFIPNEDTVLLINKYNFMEDITSISANTTLGSSLAISEQVYVIELIYKFSSFLSKNEKKAAKDLLHLKKYKPELFNLELFLKVIKIIDNSNFNFKKRNFIFHLFIDDKGLLESLIKKRK